MHSIVLQSSDATITDGDILGRLGFAASSESGTQAIKVAAKIANQRSSEGKRRS